MLGSDNVPGICQVSLYHPSTAQCKFIGVEQDNKIVYGTVPFYFSKKNFLVHTCQNRIRIHISF